MVYFLKSGAKSPNFRSVWHYRLRSRRSFAFPSVDVMPVHTAPFFSLQGPTAWQSFCGPIRAVVGFASLLAATVAPTEGHCDQANPHPQCRLMGSQMRITTMDQLGVCVCVCVCVRRGTIYIAPHRPPTLKQANFSTSM
jgi:hypothetical protein